MSRQRSSERQTRCQEADSGGQALRCPGSGSAGPFTTVTLPTGGLPAADFIELKSTRWHRHIALALRQQVRLDQGLVSSGVRPRRTGWNEHPAPSHAPQIMCIILWPFLLVKFGRPPTGGADSMGTVSEDAPARLHRAFGRMTADVVRWWLLGILVAGAAALLGCKPAMAQSLRTAR